MPKILFLRWSVTVDPNDLINQAKEIIMQTSTHQNLYENRWPHTSTGPSFLIIESLFSIPLENIRKITLLIMVAM
jgi:hypothetical protein